MPRALPVDWKEIENLYVNGLTTAAIARRYGISDRTIQNRVARKGWRQKRINLHQELSKTRPEDMQARSQSWQEQIADLMETRLNHLKSISPDKLKLSDLETLARITELTDKQARRTFGLDQQQQPVSVGLVGITLHVQAYEKQDQQGVAGKVVDVDSTSVQDGESKGP